MYNVYGSQNEFVERITRVFILRMRSLGQNGPLRRNIVFFAVASIMSHLQIWFTHYCIVMQSCVMAMENVGTVEPRYKEVGYNKTLL